MTKAVIFGFAGAALTPDEIAFFKKHNPYGFIIFARNVENPTQLKNLTDSLREISGNKNLPILIDQEGGRVARLKPPHWPAFPACGSFESCPDPEKEAYQTAKKIAEELVKVGINFSCAPMLDVRQKNAHDIVGNRAFSENAEVVAKLGRAYMNGLQDTGVIPVIKHIPGHGRAKSDSHLELPVVNANLQELETDFYPFEKLNDAPYAMTAHIIYTAIDPENCATQSRKVIKLIREKIGFKGLIMTDDLSMKALTGTFAERTKKSLDAGCDLILHCNGDMSEMQEIAAAL